MVVALVAGCEQVAEVSQNDAGRKGDAGLVPVDAGNVVTPDSGVPQTSDAGVAVDDAGADVRDAAVDALDSGLVHDAGGGTGDAGNGALDAGVGAVDAGLGPRDAGVGFDAGTPVDCAALSVRCVDDTSGPTQEYATIAAATSAAQPGDTVLVHPGHYAGFQIRTSGTLTAPITFRALNDQVFIDSPIPSGGGIAECVNSTGICIVGVNDLEGLHDLVIDGFHIENTGKRCVASHEANPGFLGGSSPHQRITLRHLTCVGAGHEGLYLSELYDSLVEDNEVLNAGSDGTDRGHGIYLANAGCDKTVLRRNFIHWEGHLGPPEGAGIHFNGDTSVDGNGGGDGLITDVVVEQNVIRGANHNGLNMDGVQHSTIRNNVISNIARNAIVVYAIDAAAGAKDLIIVNNTFVIPSSSGGAAIKLENDEGGHVIFNNVLVHLAGGPTISVANSNFASDFNVLNGTFEMNETTQSKAQWGHDANSTNATAAGLFVSATDFHLKAGAVAVDFGIGSFQSVAAPTVDQAGTARPRGTAFDVGAYEQ